MSMEFSQPLRGPTGRGNGAARPQALTKVPYEVGVLLHIQQQQMGPS